MTADRIIEELNNCGVTHVVCLPDNGSQFLYQALTSRSDFTVVPVCRKGAAIAIAAGLLLGGKKTVVLHQNTGFFESGDSVRGPGLDLMFSGAMGKASSIGLGLALARPDKRNSSCWMVTVAS